MSIMDHPVMSHRLTPLLTLPVAIGIAWLLVTFVDFPDEQYRCGCEEIECLKPR